jgi:hypothetical protein
MASTRKSAPTHRKTDSQRLALKLRARSSPSRGASERRPSASRIEAEGQQTIHPERANADPLRVIDVVTADLTKYPRH